MKHSLFETAVGALVLAVAALFFVYGAQKSDFSGSSGYTLNAKFGRIDGLAPGADVRLAGVKIGSVARQGLDKATYEAAVEFTITSDIQIPEDSVAKVTLDGLLGGSYVSIEPGGSDIYLADGESFTITQGSVDLIGLASRAVMGGPGSEE